MSRFFPKSVRVTAFITACIAAGIALFGEMDTKYIAGTLASMDGGIENSYDRSEEYRRELKNMYEQLCILGVCELANTDSSGKYIGNKNVRSDLMYYFDFNRYPYKKTDEGIVPASEMFDYYLSYTVRDDGDETVTDDETTSAEDTADRMVTHFVTNISEDIVSDKMTEQERVQALTKKINAYILRSGDVISSDMISSGTMDNYNYQVAEDGGKLNTVSESYPDNYLPMGGWYSDSYGRYVLNFCNDSPIKFYIYPENTDEGSKARREWIDIESNTEGYGIYYSTLPICDMPDYKATAGETEGLTVFIAPRKGLFKDKSEKYNEMVNEMTKANKISVSCGIIALVLTLYLIAAAAVIGRAGERGNAFADRIPYEIFLVLALFAFSEMSFAMDYGYYNVINSSEHLFIDKLLGYAVFGLIYAAVSGVVIYAVTRTTELIFGRRLKKSFVLPRLIDRLSEKYRSTAMYEARRNRAAGTDLMLRSIISLAAFILSILALPYALRSNPGNDEIYLFIALAVCLASSLYFIYSQIRAILLARDITKLDRRITALNRNTPFEEEISPFSELSRPSDMLKNISDTVSEAVEEQIKSERMKIELVANVSHDLKTPLTSIISYIDLLKKTELDDEAMGYVMILDKKSQKLKSIVADVFSLAKATSGIDVNMEELDFVRLFNQSIADADDKIKESGKTVKTTVTEDTAPVMGDGSKLYRVLQNLIDNALKYSMDGSRIFIDLKRADDYIVLTVKNMSSYPIDFTADEITERFVRGDRSRTDGGSGLGLSIAKSFTEACGGRFDIELDGDMFKAVMAMPLIKKQEPEEKETI